MSLATPGGPNRHHLAVERSRLVRLATSQSTLYVTRTIEYFEALLNTSHEFGTTKSEDRRVRSLFRLALRTVEPLAITLEDLRHEWIGMRHEARRIERKVNRHVARMFSGETGIPTFVGILREARELA